MDVSEIVSSINDHGFEDASEDRKVEKINNALWAIEGLAPWPWLEKTTTLNFNGSSPNPTNMPADFKAVLWVTDTTNGVSIWPERASTIRDRYGNNLNDVNDPFAYYFIGNTIYFYPIPESSTGRFTLDYIATQTEVTAATLEAAILLPKRHHEAIVFKALMSLYAMEDDPEQLNVFTNLYNTKVAEMHEDMYRRQYQRADRIFVVDEDDDYYL